MSQGRDKVQVDDLSTGSQIIFVPESETADFETYAMGNVPTSSGKIWVDKSVEQQDHMVV
jgi:hypothetical protein